MNDTTTKTNLTSRERADVLVEAWVLEETEITGGIVPTLEDIQILKSRVWEALDAHTQAENTRLKERVKKLERMLGQLRIWNADAEEFPPTLAKTIDALLSSTSSTTTTEETGGGKQ